MHPFTTLPVLLHTWYSPCAARSSSAQHLQAEQCLCATSMPYMQQKFLLASRAFAAPTTAAATFHVKLAHCSPQAQVVQRLQRSPIHDAAHAAALHH